MGRTRLEQAITANITPYPTPRFDLIAIDLDGTLLRSDKQAAKYDAVAIREAVRRGVRVVIATARPPRSSIEIHGRLGLDTPIINYNGALIHDPVAICDLQHQPLRSETARQVVEIARSIDPSVIVDIEVLDKSFTDRENPKLKTETGKKFRPDFVGPLDEILTQPVTKLMFLAESSRLGPIRHAVLTRFPGRVGVMLSDDHIMQIVNPAVDKGSALAWVAGRFGISAEKVCAIGDAPNDAGMLRWAGLGIAVGNAFGSARDHADVIFEHTNDNWAVGRAIEAHVLGDNPVERQVASKRSRTVSRDDATLT